MMRLSMIVGASVLLAAATGQGVGSQPLHRFDVDLSNFKLQPARIVLRAEQPYVIHLTNSGSGAHDFKAYAFFAAAKVDPRDAARIGKGEVELARAETADIHVIAPAAGRYELHCGHFMHSAFGMKGEIVVE